MKKIILLLLAIAFPAATQATETNTVTIAAASDLALCLDDINAQFSAVHPSVVCKVSTGSSGNFFAQIQRGAPFDVFLSADKNYPQKLIASGFAVTNTMQTYAIGRLVLWSLNTNFDSAGLKILTNDVIKKIAIANPDTAPYGRAAKAVLQNAKLWDALQPKIVIGENIAQTAQFVQTKNADAGFVALSFTSSPKFQNTGTRWLVPQNLYPQLEQAAVLTTYGAENPAAKEYLEFLKSSAARKIFDRFGFRLPEK
jgi:molybdate transport system substrate-binding protein